MLPRARLRFLQDVGLEDARGLQCVKLERKALVLTADPGVAPPLTAPDATSLRHTLTRRLSL